MIDKIYHGFLWFCGFLEGEHISDMLWRQKDRLGRWYYLLLAFVLTMHFLVLIDNIKKRRWGMVVLGAFASLALVWVIPHIFGVW